MASNLIRRFRDAVPKPSLKAKGTENVHGEDMWLDNDDVRPLKLADRTWNLWTYLTFWFSATATVSGWYAAASAQALGLSMWESVGTAFGGQVVIAIVIVFNGRAGAKYHIGFPILNRASFGVFGAWWPTFNRAVMAIVWNGVNAVQGSALDSGGMIGFVVFWVCTCFFLVIPIPKMKGLVYAKLIVFVISAISMLAWTLTKAGGIGHVVSQPGTAKGSERTWLMIRFFLLGAANCATFASNAADFQRYATKPNDVIIGNLVGFPVANLLVAIVGNLVAASSQAITGELIWNPITFLDTLQSSSYTPGNRAGCFFIAACFSYSAIFSSIFENSLPAGNDIAALFPKYLTVRKGFFICAVVSFAINPWYLLGSASIFISFLASYQIFLSSITGVLLCHYYIITRGYLEIEDLYTSRKDGVYHYFHGWNWRAYLAYVIGIAPNFYGFLNNMGVDAPIGITKAYYFAYEIGLFLSFFTYWAACTWSPPALTVPLSEWREPRDYVRPEERGEVIEGVVEDVEFGNGGGEKGVGGGVRGMEKSESIG
ncbi:putative Uridine permease [Glarea lozoyensis 74030]|uniref:Putative Uridine permease n=1 Tax=Glarea lozoyensis (strain ATCC 74030 / MF5533) TaxID=1104152 RepID=H0ECG4_GLAL7|nr:putative Uridine permease [Glarea lozoyensis 74030]